MTNTSTNAVPDHETIESGGLSLSEALDTIDDSLLEQITGGGSPRGAIAGNSPNHWILEIY